MSRKDYVLIAKQLNFEIGELKAKFPTQADVLESGIIIAASGLARELKHNNANFDYDKFMHVVKEGTIY